MKLRSLLPLLALAAFSTGCQMSHPAGSFADDQSFAAKHTPVVVLSDSTGKSKVLVAPALQGRVLTSTAAGDNGGSYGWINRELLASGQLRPHINAFGGEDRFWIGPEGGQFSIFFPPGVPFDFEHWQTPPVLDSEPFAVVSKDAQQVSFQRKFELTNYSKNKFQVQVDRQVRLLDNAAAWKLLGASPAGGVKLVAYESVNRITNAGTDPWTKSTGLLSIWILGMFNASPDATVVVPFRQGPEDQLGKIVESGYFGTVPPDRLKVKDGLILFRADAKFRSKIGVNPARAFPLLGSYDSGKKLLTFVQYSKTPGVTQYVNSQWKIQENPFNGDVENSYSDGPNATGSSLGNFYEVESSSPAVELAPGESVQHVHRTIHLSGDEAQLDKIAQAILGVHLKDITTK
jgi:hypothetical protein